MKGYITEIFRNLIISILVVICIVLIVAFVFYDKIALSKVIPEVEEYFLTDEMKQEIEDGNLEEAEEVIVNYHIDASDLKKYEKNSEYIKGKNHPFAKTSIYTGDSSDSENNNSGGFFEDDGTK